MPLYDVKSISDGRTLYSGDFLSLRDCVETAIQDNISLRHADLRRVNLLNATLDGADLRGVDFTGANLCGANLSEARLEDCLFFGTSLINAVLCESGLRGAHFINSSFGATLIDHSVMDHVHFAGLSAFSLDFTGVKTMRHCGFLNPCGTLCPMTRPPVVIQGLSRPLVLLDRHFKIGHDLYDLDDDIGRDLRPVGHGILNPRQLRLGLEQVIAGHHAKAA